MVHSQLIHHYMYEPTHSHWQGAAQSTILLLLVPHGVVHRDPPPGHRKLLGTCLSLVPHPTANSTAC